MIPPFFCLAGRDCVWAAFTSVVSRGGGRHKSCVSGFWKWGSFSFLRWQEPKDQRWRALNSLLDWKSHTRTAQRRDSSLCVLIWPDVGHYIPPRWWSRQKGITVPSATFSTRNTAVMRAQTAVPLDGWTGTGLNSSQLTVSVSLCCCACGTSTSTRNAKTTLKQRKLWLFFLECIRF